MKIWADGVEAHLLPYRILARHSTFYQLIHRANPGRMEFFASHTFPSLLHGDFEYERVGYA